MKKMGCCTSCEKEVYEITRRFPSDHPYSREPIEVGKPIDAVIKTFLLTDGSTMDLTYCPDCVVNFPQDWNKVLEAWAREISDEYRKNIGIEIIKDKTKHKEWFNKMLSTLPIAILGEKRA